MYIPDTSKIFYGSTSISKVYYGGTQVWPKGGIDYTKIPFTVEALGSGQITWGLGAKTLQYSKNGGSWETMGNGTTISVVEGDKVQFKGTNLNLYCNTFASTARFNAVGNIMSLTDGDNFKTADTVNANAFYCLFSGCTTIVSVINLILPATTLAESCYASMFDGCTSLTTAPELPATTLANSCYSAMFDGCTSLTTAPELPATTLARGCCFMMFSRCTSLTTAPKLPAMVLAAMCYYMMFRSCTSLTTVPELPATTLVNACYCSMFAGCTSLNYIKAMFTTTPSYVYTQEWVDGVASTGTFVKNAAATWNVTGINGIPNGWTVITA